MGKTYFASDFHLGIDTEFTSLAREKLIVEWLKVISQDADAIYLLGDVFDFWFEYKTVVPKGYTRLLGSLAACTDSGIPVHWIVGNHDMWTFGYLEDEVGVRIYKDHVVEKIYGKNIFMGHGDGLDQTDYMYKVFKKLLSSPFCQRLFSILSPRLGLFLMKHSSKTSRDHQNGENASHQDLIEFCKQKLTEKSFDFFLFGHKHEPKLVNLGNDTSYYINLGDWTSKFTYAVLNEDGEIQMKEYPKPS